MDRPIVWALGILGTTVISAVSLGPKLSMFSESADSAPAVAKPSAGAAVSTGPKIFSVAADYRGHFTIHPTVKNLRLRMLVDTGASVVALTDSDARSMGLKLSAKDYTMRMNTANGTLLAARTWIDEMKIGDITVRNIEAVVMPAGAMSTSLLGMSFLKRLNGFEISSGRLTLKG